ncbi:group I truncated hemoglobin [Cohnella lupini]|uniref:Group 1 truncated hemoglobin n=1 Tax=Cohnella lupini TaxID=1294267 RepID=A0A3D9I8P4_9BACL|nr:group 1 truncated hemoglobin [Cohnella lupini]RED58015.1 hemoglobin [Cohnella lupini]
MDNGSEPNISLLYDRLGGRSGIQSAVELFYAKVKDDPRVSHYFRNIDFAKLMEHQTVFLSFATGGPDYYTGKSLKQSHEHLNITSAHFDDVLGHLTDSLVESGVTGSDVVQVLALLLPLKARLIQEPKKQ